MFHHRFGSTFIARFLFVFYSLTRKPQLKAGTKVTTFNYRLDLNDSEYLAVERALQIAIAHCDEEMKDGPKCPHYAIKSGCIDVLKKLYASPAKQMSSYTPPKP